MDPTSTLDSNTMPVERVKKPRALVLMSGGLDSSIAAKMLKEQGVDVIGIYFYTGFCITAQKSRTGLIEEPKSDVTKVAEQIGIQLEMIDISKDYIPMVSKPKYGYGKNMNPCVDCRIFMLREARKLMDFYEADFVATGEVLGQRPKSQMPATQRVVEKESGLEGLLVRPLSYKHFPETIPEKKGWIQREGLGDITGRSRKVQMELARQWGISEAATPAGGCCFLADETYSARFKDILQDRKKLLDEQEAKPLSSRDVVVLGLGRHIKLRPGLKMIIGRHEGENNVMRFYRQGRLYATFDEDVPGPSGMLDLIASAPEDNFHAEWAGLEDLRVSAGSEFEKYKAVSSEIGDVLKLDIQADELLLAAGLMLRYRKKGDPESLPLLWSFTDEEGKTVWEKELLAFPYDDDESISAHHIRKKT